MFIVVLARSFVNKNSFFFLLAHAEMLIFAEKHKQERTHIFPCFFLSS